MKKILFGVLTLFSTVAAVAGDLSEGRASAVPVPEGRAPIIDGDLGDWDLSAGEPCWITPERAARQHLVSYFMYDETALYFGAEMALEDHDYTNDNRPLDRYWNGDCLQLRLSTDTELKFPLPATFGSDQSHYGKDNRRIAVANLWKNTRTGEDNLYLTYGAHLDGEPSLNPEGSALKIRTSPQHATFEARIPWTALGCADGKMPVRPGAFIPAVLDVKWAPGGDGFFAVSIFNRDPGAFAFMSLESWGRLFFAEKGDLPARHGGLKSVIDRANAGAAEAFAGCTPVTVTIPKRGKLSVNVYDENGLLLRELMGGEEHEAGEVTAWWDGRDARGFPCATGKTYIWRAYLHDGLGVEYVGTVGTAGNPPHETKDGRGGWGADHGPAVAAAADATGRYFIWHVSESGRALVKTDYAGKVLWRASPFVVDGWCNFTCGATLGGKLYLVYERHGKNAEQFLVRIDGATGAFDEFPGHGSAVPLGFATHGPAVHPKSAIRPDYIFGVPAIAALGDRLVISAATDERIVVVDPSTGRRLVSVPFPKPRGLAVFGGTLYAVSADGFVAAVDLAHSSFRKVVAEGLVNPYGLAIDSQGRFHVSDLGGSQQVKTFAPDGMLVRTLGKPGGRAVVGAYDPDAFLYPFSLACGTDDVLIVPEASTPKVFSLIAAESGVTTARLFGYTSYSPSVFPDCDDPRTVYYSLSGPDAIARARIPDAGGAGAPEASWDFMADARLAKFGPPFTTFCMGEVVRATNGLKYLVADSTGLAGSRTRPRVICRIDGATLTPVACLFAEAEHGHPTVLKVWSDANGDGDVQEDETMRLASVEGRTIRWATETGSMLMRPDGTLYLVSHDNCIVRLPSAGFNEATAPVWEIEKATLAVPKILPYMKEIWCGWRGGVLGLGVDSAGAVYTAINTNIPYVDEEFAKKMHTGMGHTADMNAVLMTKHLADGSLAWIAGRKPLAAARPGELLHHWVYGGLICDAYTTAASEWGCQTIYTTDGFYVDRLFDTPGLPGRGFPYTFGGEDFSGRLVYYADRDEVWCYNSGHAYRVTGFEKGRVKGEMRFSGSVTLTTVKSLVRRTGERRPVEVKRLVARPQSDADWRDVPTTRLQNVATFQIVLADERLVVRTCVTDPTPGVNVAPSLAALFKGGDAVGLELGTIRESMPQDLPDWSGSAAHPGCVRLLAAPWGDRTVVVAWKPVSDDRQPQAYATPAGGSSPFDWFGEVPGATAETVRTENGYCVTWSVPLAFLPCALDATTAIELEVLCSGEGGRGVGTVGRVYHFSPASSSTTMTDDTPTESRLHPAGWGRLVVK